MQDVLSLAFQGKGYPSTPTITNREWCQNKWETQVTEFSTFNRLCDLRPLLASSLKMMFLELPIDLELKLCSPNGGPISSGDWTPHRVTKTWHSQINILK